MWKAYSAGYIRNNKTGNRFILTISFLASTLLSLVSSLFYNLWVDQVNQNIAATGNSQVEITPAIIMGSIIGIGLGWAFMAFIISSTAKLRDYTLTFAYSPIVFLGSLAFSILTAAISAWIPAKKLSKMTPLDAIRYGNEPVIKRVKKYRIQSAIFGIYGELACKSLYARRKAMRMGTLSIFLAVFSCVSLLNMFGISNLSTEKNYFDRFKNNWDFLITTEGDTYSKDLLENIRKTENVTSCIVHRILTSSTLIPGEYLSDEVQKLELENLNGNFIADEANAYDTKAPIYILDDNSFEEYRGETIDGNVIAVNIIWDSINSERTNRQYVPFLSTDKEILLNLDGTTIPIEGFAQTLPVLRESLEQYSLSLVMSESYYDFLSFNLTADETIYTIKMADESKNDVVKGRLQQLLVGYPEYDFESRVEEHANELEIQKGLRMLIYAFTGVLTCIGLANIFASTLGQIHQRKREFARYFAVGLTPKGAAKILTWEATIVALRPIFFTIVINIPLMIIMLNAGGISAQEFIAKRLPVIPAISLFVAVIGFVGLAYYLGGKKICDMNLADAIKDDTLSM